MSFHRPQVVWCISSQVQLYPWKVCPVILSIKDTLMTKWQLTYWPKKNLGKKAQPGRKTPWLLIFSFFLTSEQEPPCGVDSLCGASDMGVNAMQAQCNKQKWWKKFWKRKPYQSPHAIEFFLVPCPRFETLTMKFSVFWGSGFLCYYWMLFQHVPGNILSSSEKNTSKAEIFDKG